MATKSKIGIFRTDGSIESIKCWRDSLPEHVGEILATHYATVDLADELIEGGDLLDIENDTDYCTYEHRDKLKPWDECKPETYRSLGHFLNSIDEFDYLYIFYQGRWCVYNPCEPEANNSL